MDGRSRMVLHSTNVIETYAITLDYDNQVLYWADYTLNRIESSNADGSNRRLLSTSITDPSYMTFYNGQLYWGDYALNRILTGPASQPGSGTYVGGGVSYDVYGIQVVSRERQPLGKPRNKNLLSYNILAFIPVTNPCQDDNGNCTHLCLLSSLYPEGYGCECPDGMVLAGDGRTCSRKSNKLVSKHT